MLLGVYIWIRLSLKEEFVSDHRKTRRFLTWLQTEIAVCAVLITDSRSTVRLLHTALQFIILQQKHDIISNYSRIVRRRQSMRIPPARCTEYQPFSRRINCAILSEAFWKFRNVTRITQWIICCYLWFVFKNIFLWNTMAWNGITSSKTHLKIYHHPTDRWNFPTVEIFAQIIFRENSNWQPLRYFSQCQQISFMLSFKGFWDTAWGGCKCVHLVLSHYFIEVLQTQPISDHICSFSVPRYETFETKF